MSSAGPQGLQAFPEALSTRESWLEPFDWYREMREDAPVRYDPARSTWDVFRYSDVKRILNDDATFSVDPENATDFVEPEGEGEGLILDTMLFEDPPRHDSLRNVVEGSFRPRAIRDLEPRIRELAGDLLDDVLAGDGEMDIVSDLAYPLPVIVIAELLGVPADDRDRFKEWSDAIVASTSDREETAEYATRQQEVQREMGFYFLQLIEERREDPQDDLVSTIATAEVDGEPLPREEALEILRAMRAHRLAANEKLRAMEPMAAEKDDPFPLIVLRGGLEFTEWFAEWCERMEAQILASPEPANTEKRSS